jgi:hypothetical protein
VCGSPGELVVADTTQAVAYNEALRGVQQQQVVLGDLRGRAATLLGVASVATSFLGGIALSDGSPSNPSWFAIGAFVAVGLLTISILLPRKGWIFRLSARALIRDYIEAESPVNINEMHRDLALHIESHFEQNEKRLNRLFWLFRASSATLVVEILLWLFALIGKQG